MKRLIGILIIITLFACDSESTLDCFQTAGTIVQEEVIVPNFDRILVNRDIELVIKQGLDYQVIIETGENLLNDVTAKVVNNQLILTDTNRCNFVRDFGITKIYVTTPVLEEIRCSTQFDILSDGVLAFDDLTLVSENFNAPETFPIGDFRFNLDVDNLRIDSNNLSFYYLSGVVNNLSINFSSGNGRFEGRDLIAQNVSIFHRGSNDMIINAQQALTGIILSTGNVISVNQPQTVDVNQVFNGRLIFE
jgi:hypothetical protein